MRTINRIRLVIFLFVAGIHGLLIYGIVFDIKAGHGSVPPPVERFINLADIREEIPLSPSSLLPKPQIQQKNPPIMPLIPKNTPEPATETLIETEDFLPVLVPTVAESVPKQEDAPNNLISGTAGTGTYTGNKEKETALTAAYVKNNLSYIHRHIRDKLVYPPQARRAGVQGTTDVVFTIHQDGNISDVSVRVSSGQEILDKAAIDAIYAAAPFHPSPPVQARIVISVTFKLR